MAQPLLAETLARLTPAGALRRIREAHDPALALRNGPPLGKDRGRVERRALRRLPCCEGCGASANTQVPDILIVGKLRWLCDVCHTQYGAAFARMRADEPAA